MLDFNNINAFEKDQRESFESLLCVLANREKPVNGKEFQSNDGRGGDGGVEALWINSDGTKIGYQSKFFWSFGPSQLSQMNKSVNQALATHSELKKYIFAIPFDPTPDRGPKTSGKSEREKWDDKISEWKVSATEKGIELEFELWTKTTITNKLYQEENSELLRHWFQEEILNDSWFRSQIENASLKLGDRFNPDDHVDVTIEKLFDAIVRGPAISEKITTAFENLDNFSLPDIEFKVPDLAHDKAVLRETKKAWQNFLPFRGRFPKDLSKPWYVAKALEQLATLKKHLEKLGRQYLSVSKDTLEKGDQYKLKDILDTLSKLSEACNELEKILSNDYTKTEEKRCALIYGDAGVGKSHLLARVAEERIKQGLPTVLLLGQDYSNLPFWFQTGNLLGLKGFTSKEILSVLNALGLRKKQRILLMFDAINEGVGSQYWYKEIPNIVKELKYYSHVSVVFSCRKEYLPYAVQNGLSESLPKFPILGFRSPVEIEQAAKRYLNKNGIARPNTPWLAPEFSNPLFLKCVSESLAAKKLSEFPRGLQGISEIMAIYLDALSWRVETSSANAKDLANIIKPLVQEIAKKMAQNKTDYLKKTDASPLVDKFFSGRTPPVGKNWLQVLNEASLFRFDPPPFLENHDPLNPPSELIRFTFQRFQDHLMAIALTKQIKSGRETEAFNSHGPLSFLLVDSQSGKRLNYQFAGLLSALMITFPEKLSVEFAMTLPDWEQFWENSRIVQEGFYESFKWRKVDSFSPQTRDLLNKLHLDIFGLLLEVSMTKKHPYNANWLHERLKKLDLPGRDSMWTNSINHAFQKDDSQIERIMSWAFDLLDNPVDDKHLELASLILTWCLSSSCMTLRDQATKALTTVFLANHNMFKFVAQSMHDCDDPYVIERLYAAAFGACCLDPEVERLSTYSRLTYDLIFSKGKPPLGLLVRDYALGIMELAEVKGALSSEIFIRKCQPPFSSSPPTFNLKKEDVEIIADRAGGNQIFDSASSDWGDYGKYIIPGRVESFLSTSLSEPKPLSKDEIKKQFLKEVIKPFPERDKALYEFENNLNDQSSFIKIKLMGDYTDEDAEQQVDHHDRELEQSRETLERLLAPDEKIRLSTEYLHEGKVCGEFEKVSVNQCRLWVTKRAYDFGWTADRFPRDGHVIAQSWIYNDMERIGKKYQRIALDEIQARLADNFWYLPDWPEEPTKYRYSHHGFRRNIEPTILPFESRYRMSDGDKALWITQPHVKLPNIPEENLKQWPFKFDPTESFEKNLIRTDQTDHEWLVLYEYNSDRQKYIKPYPNKHDFQSKEFRFIYCVFLQKGTSADFVKYLNREQNLHVRTFEPLDFTDGPYLLEAFWRDTWQSEKFLNQRLNGPDDFEFAIPVASYHWESHLDKTLPDGFSKLLPQKWFADELEIKMAVRYSNTWVNSENREVLLSTYENDARSAIVIKKSTLLEYFEKFEVEPVWILISERNTWPNNNLFYGRRSEATVWIDGENLRLSSWKKDYLPK